MAADWFQTTVGNYCPFLYGKGLPREKRIHGNIPVVSSAGISGLHDQALVQSKGVVIGRKGTVGSITYCDKPFWPIDTTFYIPDEPEKRDVRFTYYLLKTIGLETMNSDSAVPGLNRDNAHAAEIKIPPLAEQKRIASILGALDDKIELNRRMNAKLEDMARTLFKSWFVDFAPVRAKLDGRPPAGMDAATAELFADAFEETAFGLIPKGWAIGKIADIGLNLRRVVQPGNIAPNTPYIALEHMPRRCIALGDWEDTAYVASGKSAFEKGEILFGKLRPYFHKVGVAPFDGVCSTDILVLKPKSPGWFGFLLSHVSSQELIQFTDATSTGTKMPRTNWSDISSFQVALPSKPIAAAFTRNIQSKLARIHANVRESRTLSNQRDMLLLKLLSVNIAR